MSKFTRRSPVTMQVVANGGPSAPDASVQDKELTLAFKRGEKGAYQEIYDRHARRVHGICRRMLSNRQDADEAAQETFLRVYTALGNFNGRYQLGAWIARITTNVCLDQLRARARRPVDVTSFDDGIDAEEIDSQEGDPEALYIKRTEGHRVRSVLAQLPPMHRAAIVLRDFEGFSYIEIANVLGITEPQVKALLHRARGGFRRQWSTSGLAALLPWKLLTRLRKPEVLAEASSSSAGHVAPAAAPAMHTALSCFSALQQCGQVLTERIAMATAAIVTTTVVLATGGATSHPLPPPDDGFGAHRSMEDIGSRVRATGLEHHEDDRVKAKEKVTEAVQPAADAEPAPDDEEPAPGPTATPPTEPTEEPEEGPTYAPVAPAIGWERGQPIPRTAPKANHMELDCGARTFRQELESVIHDGANSYPARVVLDLGSGANFDLYVQKDGQEVWYDGGSGSIVEVGSGRETTWGANGSYSAMGTVDPRDVGLPLYGRFTLQLSVDCIAASVVTEKLSLATS